MPGHKSCHTAVTSFFPEVFLAIQLCRFLTYCTSSIHSAFCQKQSRPPVSTPTEPIALLFTLQGFAHRAPTQIQNSNVSLHSRNHSLAYQRRLLTKMTKIISSPMTDANVLLQNQTAASAGLRANLVCRVLFAILGTLLCWVPFRLLWRNGEVAAVVFIIGVVITNFFTVINSLLWRNDYWGLWWDGQGWCDLQVWLTGPLQTIFAAAIFAIMRHLAQQVGMMRVTTLSRKEKRRRNLIQALIIFPIPLVQLAFSWFDLAQRYIIGTLVGCSATYDNSWPKIVVYSIPPMLFALGSVPYACE